ncbi:hypothetical protein GWI34_28330 [Actinomadura sp. DSM 109109]|nr:hypothetical protein [Actinomadura lepetitiana]
MASAFGGVTGRRGRPARRAFPHLLVLLPGLGGSALRREDEEIWGTAAALARAAADPRRLAPPKVPLDDPEYDDGVEAHDLMAIPVPGFSRILGPYQKLRSGLRERFELDDANYLEFAYDWRRPVAVSSARLAAAVAPRLASLRERFPAAGVIVVAHSMGGLVAVDYLRRHDPRRDCRRVYTLGTPFRGAVKALDTLVNGPRLGPVPAARLPLGHLAEALHRLPSVYELLPMYPVIADARTGSRPAAGRVAELAGALAGLDAARALASREFLLELNSPHERLSVVRPVVGYGQRTAQHAVLRPDGRLEVSKEFGLLPVEEEAGGDGTVPALSASPAVYQEVPPVYRNQTHNGLAHGGDQVDELIRMLGYDLSRLARRRPVLYPGLADAPAPAPSRAEAEPDDFGPPAGERALGLDLADAYLTEEPVTVTGRAEGFDPGDTLWFRLSAGASPDAGDPTTTVADDGSFTVPLGVLRPGLYTLSVAASPQGDGLLDVVHVA